MNNNEEIKYYQNALNKDEITIYGLVLDKYKSGVIDYQQLKNLFLGYGITIKPEIVDFTNAVMSVKDSKEVQKRLDSQNYLFEDIKSYIFVYGNGSKILFEYDSTVQDLVNTFNESISKQQEKEKKRMIILGC